MASVGVTVAVALDADRAVGVLAIAVVSGSAQLARRAYNSIVSSVERLYCKRPILYLASSKILTLHPPHCPASVCAFGAGGTHLPGGEGGGG
jgi:hypothetical protein